MTEESSQAYNKGIDVPLWEFQLKLADYHRKAMESRRAIELRVLTGMIIFQLVLAASASQIINYVANPTGFKVLLVVSYAILPIFFGGFVWHFESRNKDDRDVYKPIERNLRQALRAMSKGQQPGWQLEVHSQKWWEVVLDSAGATWGFLATLLISVFCGLLVLFLKPQ